MSHLADSLPAIGILIGARFGAKLTIAIVIYAAVIFGGGYLIRRLTRSLLSSGSQPESASPHPLRVAIKPLPALFSEPSRKHHSFE